MIDIDPQVQQESEPEGYEFGYYTFDTLPTLEVSNVEATQNTSIHVNDTDAINNDLWELPISNDTLSQLQTEGHVLQQYPNPNRKRKYKRTTAICNERQIIKEICCRW